jgi:hypothetical protein
VGLGINYNQWNLSFGEREPGILPDSLYIWVSVRLKARTDVINVARCGGQQEATIFKPPDAAAPGVFVTAFSDQPLARACRKMSQAVTKEKAVRRRLGLEHEPS